MVVNDIGEDVPDLHTANRFRDRATVAAGEQLHVRVQVRNSGRGDAAASRVGFYLSEDQLWDDEDTLVGFEEVGALHSSTNVDINSQITIPANWNRFGRHYILYVADYQRVIEENDEANNTGNLAVTIEDPNVPLPDLTIDDLVTRRDVYTPGTRVEFTFYHTNSGSAETGDTYVDYFLSRDDQLSNDDISLTNNRGRYAGVGPNQSSFMVFRTNIPANTIPGTYHIIASADIRDQVEETNEQNNESSIEILVRNGDDALEPNDIWDQALQLGEANQYRHNNLFIDLNDQDWFTFTYERETYYFVIEPGGFYGLGDYGLSFTRSGRSVTIQTLQVGMPVETRITLYNVVADANPGPDLPLAEDADSGSNNMSRIVYQLPFSGFCGGLCAAGAVPEEEDLDDNDRDGISNLAETAAGSNIEIADAAQVYSLAAQTDNAVESDQKEKNSDGDPVNIRTGSFEHTQIDLQIPGRGAAFDITRIYNSTAVSKSSRFGNGWSYSYNQYYYQDPDTANVILYKGGTTIGLFETDDGGETFITPPGESNKLYTEEGNFVFETFDGVKYTYGNHVSDALGLLTAITDTNGNTTNLHYTNVWDVPLLTSVEDAAGREVTLSYGDPDSILWDKVQQIDANLGDGQQQIIDYTYDNTLNLIEVDKTIIEGDNERHEIDQFTHTESGLITTHTDPRDTVLYNHYDGEGRVTLQEEFNPEKDEQGAEPRRIYTFTYSGANAQVPGSSYCSITREFNDDDTQARTVCFNEDHLRIFSADAAGNSITKTRDANGMITQITDEENNVTRYVYDANRRVIQEILPDSAQWHTEIFYEYGPYNRVTERREVATSLVDPQSPAIERITRFAIDEENGNILSITDPMGFVESFAYDDFGNVVRHTDKRGNDTTYTYDELGNYLMSERQVVTLPDGAEQVIASSYEYDDFGNRTSYTDPNGNTTRYTYDSSGHVLTETNAIGGVNNYEYDVEGHRVAQVDARGNRTEFVYDTNILANLLETSRIGAEGNIVERRGYDNIGRLASQTDANGEETTYTYDSAGRLVETVTPVETTTLAYDTKGNVVRELHSAEDDTLSESRFVYDARNQLIEKREYTAADAFVSTQYVYDGFGRMVFVTDPNDNDTANVYDVNDRLIRTVDAAGGVREFAYDRGGNKVGERSPRAVADASLRNADGYSHSYQYDEANRLIREVNAENKESIFVYDPAGQLVREVDRQHEDGSEATHVTQYVYDVLGRVVRETDALGSVRVSAYDEVGNLTSLTDELGRETAFAYDEFDRLVQEEDPAGNVTQYSYDGNGNRLSVTYPDNTVTRYAYDEGNRLETVTDALGNVSRTVHDGLGRLLSETDKLGAQTIYGYDWLGRLTRETNAAGSVTTYSYDASGNRRVQDVAGQQTRFAYDALHRVVLVTNPGDKLEAFTYDADGNVLTATDGELQETTYSYDALGRVVRKVLADESAVTYAYDNWDNQTRVSQDELVTLSTFDALGRLVREEQQFADLEDPAVVLRTYARDGQLLSLTDAADRVFGYVYDARGLLRSVNHAGDALATYGYTSFGKPLSVTYANGVRTGYMYDALQRTSRIQTLGEDGGVLFQQDYSYDEESNRLGLTENAGQADERSVQYAYDALEQLIRVDYSSIEGAGDIRFAYDDWGNRVSMQSPLGAVGYVYNGAGELTSYVENGRLSVAMQYDGNGSLMSEQYARLGRGIRDVAYRWDSQNRLSGISYAAGARPDYLPALPENSLAFVYDDFGNRIAKSVNGENSYYINDGLVVLNELSSAGDVTKSVVQGLDMIAEIDEDGVVTFVHTDVLGSTVLLTNEAGEVTAQYEYDVFGSVVGYNGSDQSNYLFTGQELDFESELYYYNARYYNPKLGRFISRDSFMGRDGDSLSRNRYIYVKNNPLKYVDPTGNESEDVMGNKAGSFSIAGFSEGFKKGFHSFDPLLNLLSFNYWRDTTNRIDQYNESMLDGELVNPLLYAGNIVGGSIASGVVGASWGMGIGEARNLVNRSFGISKMRGVDELMRRRDRQSGFIVNNTYRKNPTAADIKSLISNKGKIGVKEMSGQYMYVIDGKNNIIIGTRAGERMPHPTLIGGTNPRVQAAGIVEIRGNTIYSVNNASGHYKLPNSTLRISEKYFSQLPQSAFSKNFQGYKSWLNQ